MTRTFGKAGFLAFALATAAVFAPGGASAQTVNLRYLCYADANECDVARDLLDRFEKANPTIKVTVDKVGFAVIREQLETRLQGGEAPTWPAITNLGGLNRYYLDSRSYAAHQREVLEENFATTPALMRVGRTTRASTAS